MGKPTYWKKGRGKLGPLTPLLGMWQAQAESPQGPVTCQRTFEKALQDTYIRLTARWIFGDTAYDEIAYFGVNRDGQLCCWSFTSDGKQSAGELAAAEDVHPQAICFEMHMPAGLARQVYWPDGADGFHWVVESRNKKGWNRFVEHHYTPA
jgi:hypothetical protein